MKKIERLKSAHGNHVNISRYMILSFKVLKWLLCHNKLNSPPTDLQQDFKWVSLSALLL